MQSEGHHREISLQFSSMSKKLQGARGITECFERAFVIGKKNILATRLYSVLARGLTQRERDNVACFLSI